MSDGRRVAVVTGAAGFIGRHLVRRLAEGGGHVRCHVRPGADATGLAPGPGWRVSVHPVELGDAAGMAGLVAGAGHVFHLAGQPSANLSCVDPYPTCLANTVGTLNVLEAARRAGVARVVLMSTGQVFGDRPDLPVAETGRIFPTTPYAASKAAAELLGQSYHRTFGVPVVIARPFNVYGPGQAREAVIPTIIGQALDRGEVTLRSTAPRRDYLYVDDLVSALILCAERPEAVGHAFNLGSGADIPVGDLAARILGLMGIDGAILTSSGQPPGDTGPDRIVSDPRLAARLLGWRAGTSLQAGLRATIAWWSRTASVPGLA